MKLAISLNPNNATAHQYYSELLDILRRNNEAREHINFALKLNPYSYIVNWESALYYYNSNEYKKAIEAFEKTIDIVNTNDDLILGIKSWIIRCYINLGMNKDALMTIKGISSINYSKENDQLLDKIFEESGIEGVINWSIDWMLIDAGRFPNYVKAQFYGCIGDSQNALKYLENAFENGNIFVSRSNNSSDFRFIRTEPRFIALLKKMGLE